MEPDEPPADYTPPVICRSARHIRRDGEGYYEYFCESAHNHYWGENWWDCESRYVVVDDRVFFRFTNEWGDVLDIRPCSVCFPAGRHLPTPEEVLSDLVRKVNEEPFIEQDESRTKTLKDWVIE